MRKGTFAYSILCIVMAIFLLQSCTNKSAVRCAKGSSIKTKKFKQSKGKKRQVNASRASTPSPTAARPKPQNTAIASKPDVPVVIETPSASAPQENPIVQQVENPITAEPDSPTAITAAIAEPDEPALPPEEDFIIDEIIESTAPEEPSAFSIPVSRDETINLEELVEFVPFYDAFLDAELADEKIAEVAKFMQENPEAQASIKGTAAWVEKDDFQTLADGSKEALQFGRSREIYAQILVVDSEPEHVMLLEQQGITQHEEVRVGELVRRRAVAIRAVLIEKGVAPNRLGVLHGNFIWRPQ